MLKQPLDHSTHSQTHVAFDLRPLLAPRAVAVVGASDKPGAGSLVLANLRQLGFEGAVYPINPHYTELQGWRCYPTLRDVPGPVDSVAVLIASKHVLSTLGQAAEIGAHGAWVLASGFAECGADGRALQDEVVAFAGEHAIALCGPNCIGVANLHNRVATYSTALPPTLRPGHVGAVLQSGAVCMGIANSNRGLGFSCLISSGNEAVLDNADYIAYLADDPDTHVIIAFIEGFKHPERFVWAAERARAAGKPLLVVKVGRSAVAQRATLAHTGSLAGADAVHDAVFRKHGVVRLDSLDELLEAAELFLKAPLPSGKGVALLSLSGGQIGLIGDLMRGIDLDMVDLAPETREALSQVLPAYSNIANPLDAWGSGNFAEIYPACLNIVARDPKVHLIAASRDSSPGIAPQEVQQSLVIVDAAAQAAQVTGKPAIVFSNISTGINPAVQERADSSAVPLLQGTRSSLRAIEAFLRYSQEARFVPEEPTASPVTPEALTRLKADLARQPASLSESASKRLLSAYGIPVTGEALACSPDEAVHLAAQMAGPVALKISSPDIQHKTEARGVVLNLTDPDTIRRSYGQIIKNALAYKADARIEGVLVQEMVPPDAIEVIVGTSNDAEFGPVVVFGLGGIMVELFKDSVLRLAPVDRPGAEEMVEGVRGVALLRGFRGRPEADVEALVDTIMRVSHLAYDLRDEVAALDINPLMVLPRGRGVRAADALIVKRQ